MRTARSATRARLALLAVIAATAVGCRDEQPTIGKRAMATGSSSVAEATSAEPSACERSGPHAKHRAQGFDCNVCHACAGALAFTTFTFAGGTTTANGTIDRTGGVTTCSVGCHSPLGAPSQPVAWNAGPLECTACHANVPTSSGGASSHFAAGVGPGSCQSCHDQSRHTQGQVLIVNADGSSTSNTCVGCHRGQGQTLAGATPPLLVGWDDALKGDFHGSRAGTCRFDRLDAAGVRSLGEGGLPCPAGQPELPNALRITSRWWYVTPYSGAWEVSCDIETVDADGNRIGVSLLRQPCPEGAVLDYDCNSPQPPDPECHPQTLVTRGFGGTLLPPYARGEGPLPCTACHDAHSSTNAFLLAANVNGVTLPPHSIDRAGVGAQALCNACHAGDRHEVCKSCHRQFWVTDGEYSWFEGEPVDPAADGKPCFFCHGHEGLRMMEVATPAYPMSGHPFGIAGQDRGAECSHCHSGWRPPPIEYAAPAIRQNAWSYVPPDMPHYLAIYPQQPNPPVWLSPYGTVFNVTPTSATIYWETNERATSYVEYGIETAGYVAGYSPFYPGFDPANPEGWTTVHRVELTGLTPGTTYVWSIRTSDSYRNVMVTPLQSFSTVDPNAPAAPVLVPEPYQYNSGGSGNDPVVCWVGQPLQWQPVTAPSGNPVQYRVQLTTDGTFATTQVDTVQSDTSYPLSLCGKIASYVQWHWRVQAIDTVTGLSSIWSLVDGYRVDVGDPYNDY